MKKPIFLIIGGIIVVVLLAVWAYLFMFGTPKSAEDVFSDLGLQGSQDEGGFLPPIVAEEEAPVVNMERPKLRQLTTKNVAGFREVSLSTTTPALVYYVEMGTGHIFSIDLESGEEKRVSGTTIPKTYQANFSPDGEYVAIASLGNSKSMDLVLGRLGTSSEMTMTNFSKSVQEFNIGDSDELLYTELEGNGLAASTYNLSSGRTTALFSVPFREATVEWGSVATSTHYVFPKATYALEGFLFEAKDGELSRLPLSGFGFLAKGNEDMIVYNQSIKQVVSSFVYDKEAKVSRPLTAPVIPEKCLLLAQGFEFVCPFENTVLPYEFPDEWYKGSLSFKDSLWLLNGENMTGELLVDTFAESGRELDIIDLAVPQAGGTLYFINKNDNTLWMYEL